MENRIPNFAAVNGQSGPQTVPVQTAQPATATPSQWCSGCGAGLGAEVRFCHRCGSATQTEVAAEQSAAASAPVLASPAAEPAPEPVAATVSAPLEAPEPFPTGHVIGAIICALVALALFPPIFGGIAVVLGFLARKTNRGVGNWLIGLGIGIGAAVVGMVIGVLVATSMS